MLTREPIPVPDPTLTFEQSLDILGHWGSMYSLAEDPNKPLDVEIDFEHPLFQPLATLRSQMERFSSTHQGDLLRAADNFQKLIDGTFRESHLSADTVRRMTAIATRLTLDGMTRAGYKPNSIHEGCNYLMNGHFWDELCSDARGIDGFNGHFNAWRATAFNAVHLVATGATVILDSGVCDGAYYCRVPDQRKENGEEVQHTTHNIHYDRLGMLCLSTPAARVLANHEVFHAILTGDAVRQIQKWEPDWDWGSILQEINCAEDIRVTAAGVKVCNDPKLKSEHLYQAHSAFHVAYMRSMPPGDRRLVPEETFYLMMRHGLGAKVPHNCTPEAEEWLKENRVHIEALASPSTIPVGAHGRLNLESRDSRREECASNAAEHLYAIVASYKKKEREADQDGKQQTQQQGQGQSQQPGQNPPPPGQSGSQPQPGQKNESPAPSNGSGSQSDQGGDKDKASSPGGEGGDDAKKPDQAEGEGQPGKNGQQGQDKSQQGQAGSGDKADAGQEGAGEKSPQQGGGLKGQPPSGKGQAGQKGEGEGAGGGESQPGDTSQGQGGKPGQSQGAPSASGGRQPSPGESGSPGQNGQGQGQNAPSGAPAQSGQQPGQGSSGGTGTPGQTPGSAGKPAAGGDQKDPGAQSGSGKGAGTGKDGQKPAAGNPDAPRREWGEAPKPKESREPSPMQQAADGLKRFQEKRGAAGPDLPPPPPADNPIPEMTKEVLVFQKAYINAPIATLWQEHGSTINQMARLYRETMRNSKARAPKFEARNEGNRLNMPGYIRRENIDSEHETIFHRKPIEVVESEQTFHLVLDSSGSMYSGPDPTIRQATVMMSIQMLALLEAGHRASLSAFAQHGEVLIPPCQSVAEALPFLKTVLSRAMDNDVIHQGRAMGSGTEVYYSLRAPLEAVRISKDIAGPQSVLVFSDGAVSNQHSSMTEALLRDCKAAKIPVLYACYPSVPASIESVAGKDACFELPDLSLKSCKLIHSKLLDTMKKNKLLVDVAEAKDIVSKVKRVKFSPGLAATPIPTWKGR